MVIRVSEAVNAITKAVDDMRGMRVAAKEQVKKAQT